MGELFCVSELFWYQNVLDNRVITILLILFVSQYQKICVQPSNDSKKSGHPKFLCTKEEVNDFPGINFGLTVPKKLHGGTLLCFREVPVRKQLMEKKGGHVFLSGIVCPKSAEKIVGETFCVSELFWHQKLFG